MWASGTQSYLVIETQLAELKVARDHIDEASAIIRAWYKEVQRHQCVTEIHGRPTALMNSCKAMKRSRSIVARYRQCDAAKILTLNVYLHHSRIEAAIHNYP